MGLINQALKEPFESDSASLLCDSAVALSARHDPDPTSLRPYTQSTALNAGWVWDIPLYHRRGCGYVYSSQHLSREQAEEELRRHLGPASDGVRPNHIRMRVGRTRRSWVKNCVAIGLAGNFLAPLESTGIFPTEFALAMLVAHSPDNDFDETRADAFTEPKEDYEETRISW